MDFEMIALIIFLVIVGIILIVIIASLIAYHVAANKKSGGSSSYTYTKSSESTYKSRDQRAIETTGALGEAIVHSELAKVVYSYEGYIIDDLCFKDENGYSSEIDHIVITRGGVFVIETKTNKGTIYGSKDDDKWFCEKKSYQDDKYLTNPIKQNLGHINHLRKMFSYSSPKMISMVLFPVADISHVNETGVYNLTGAINEIERLTLLGKYSNDFVKKTYAEICRIRDTYSISKEEHINNIRNLHN